MASRKQLRKRYFNVAMRNRAYTTPARLEKHLDYMFGGTPLLERRLLDIGGGTGLLTLWAAVEGASGICLEPEADGATHAVRDLFERMKTEISPDLPAIIRADTVQDYLSSNNEKFDIIVMANSINHIAEDDCERLLQSEKSKNNYIAFFERIRSHLNPSGHLIITDCDRRNFFGDIGFKSPLMPTINWKIHQSPHTWARLIEKAGLRISAIEWSTPNFLGRPGRLLLGNRVAAYFLFSHFRLVAELPADMKSPSRGGE